MQTISSAINWWAEDTPDQLALAFGSDRINYRELRDWSERIAQMLIDRGVERGDRVGICAANSMEYCALIHGVLRAGAIVSPLNMRYTRHELAELVEWHFFAGLSFVEIAEVRGVTERTVRRHWDTARAFLLDALPAAGG